MGISNAERVVLTLLTEGGPAYGLELVAASRGRLKRGGIYVTLGRMEAKGLVTSAYAEAARRVYRPTALGRRALAATQVFLGKLKVVPA